MTEQIQKIEIDSKVTLAYQTINYSDKTKPLLVFLHEGLGSIAQWRNFPETLCTELNLPGLVYDRYGYGHSTEFLEKRKPNYLKHEAEYFLPLLIKKLQLKNRQLILIGHSDGASIALLFAALLPKNVMAVVSMAAHVFVEEISVNSIIKLEKEYELDGTLKNSLKKYHFNHTDSTFYAFSKTISGNQFKDWNIENYLSQIQAPVLVIQGENDEYGTEKQVDSIYNKSPNPKNKKLVIPNCGHSPHLSHQKIVLKELKSFIK